MQFKPSDYVAWVGIVSGALIAMKKPKKVIGWFLIVASGGYFLITAFSSSDKEKSDSHNQTSIASGAGATAQAAGRDINNGVSDATLQKVLNLKDVELSERMSADYPHGCIILGLENGKVIYDSRLKDVKVTADWDNTKYTFDETTHMMAVFFQSLI
jgi:hypothetical protein